MTNQELIDGCLCKPSNHIDQRKELKQFKVNKRGDLLIKRNETEELGDWEIFIPKKRLKESDWISHIKTKGYCDFGEFVCAYLKALEIAGAKKISVEIYGFDDTCKYADGR